MAAEEDNGFLTLNKPPTARIKPFPDDSINDAIPISGRHRPFHLRSYRLRPIDQGPRIACVGVFDTLAVQKVALGGDRTQDHQDSQNHGSSGGEVDVGVLLGIFVSNPRSRFSRHHRLPASS